MKKINKVLLIGVPIIILLAAGYWFMAPNYRNEIARGNIDNKNQDSRVYASLNTLRITRDIDVYTKEATAIVIGEFVREGGSQWNGDRTYINTATYFTVSEVLKGDIQPSTEIKLLRWGGEIDNQVQTMDGAFIYNEGKKNLLFLGTDEDGNWGVFQGDWGQFIVNEDNTVTNFSDETVILSDFKSEISKRVE